MKGKKNEMLSPEYKTIVIGCGDTGLTEAVAKYAKKKLAGQNGCVVVLDKAPLKTSLDAQMRFDKNWKHKQNVVEFVENPANVVKAFYHAKTIKVKVQKNQNIYFSLKDMVVESNMTHKGAQDMLNMLFPFGLLAIRTMGAQKQYKILDNDKARLAYLAEAKLDLENRYNEQQKQIDDLFEWVENAGAIDAVVKELEAEAQE